MALLVCLCALPAYADDIKPMPHTFSSAAGGLTINGNPAPIGTEVKAVCTNVEYGTWENGKNPFITTTAGKYGDATGATPRLQVEGWIDQLTTITFYINGVSTGQTYPFNTGTSTVLALSATGLPTIISYSNATHTTACDTFDDYSTEHAVYMYCSGNLTVGNSYKVAYYDGGGTKRATDANLTAGASGNISSQRTFQDGTDVAGTWHVLVCANSETPPSTYSEVTSPSSPLWGTILASDTFTVEQAAIPEFPTILAAVVAFSLCAGIYFWMRRKAVPVKA